MYRARFPVRRVHVCALALPSSVGYFPAWWIAAEVLLVFQP